jgi:hypothetical protein
MLLKLVKVGNGSDEYPGNFTKQEITIINRFKKGKTLNLFSGRSLIGNERIDFSCKEATINQDVFEFLKKNDLYFDTVILDPPYNSNFARIYEKLGNTPKQFIVFANSDKTAALFDLIEEKVNPKRIIIKSWNYYVPKNFKMLDAFVCYPGGYRKSTILMICERMYQGELIENWRL